MNPAARSRLAPTTPAPGEGDTNQGGERSAWQSRSLDGKARALLARNREAFLTQSISTPCLNAIAKAEGIGIDDTAGRRYMDFHGSNVHHVGYGQPGFGAATEASERAHYRALDRGLSFRASTGNVPTLTPPLFTSRTEVGRALAIVEECLMEEGA